LFRLWWLRASAGFRHVLRLFAPVLRLFVSFVSFVR
jgi:hypothetical protein